MIPTRYSPVRHYRPKPFVRLACVKHAASVRSEPGSNSQVDVHPAWQPDGLELVQSIHITHLLRDAQTSVEPYVLRSDAACASLPCVFTCPRARNPSGLLSEPGLDPVPNPAPLREAGLYKPPAKASISFFSPSSAGASSRLRSLFDTATHRFGGRKRLTQGPAGRKRNLSR